MSMDNRKGTAIAQVEGLPFGVLTGKRMEGRLPRVGKTERDHSSGAHARRISNQQERANWRNSSRGKPSEVRFPSHTCNGHRYYTRVSKRA